MISAGELKRGTTIDLDGDLWNIVGYQHVKVGRGGAVLRLKVRNLKTGANVERTFPASEKFKRVYLDHVKAQLQYRDDDTFNFMDTETFEQLTLNAEQIGDDVNYLTENLVVDMLKYEDRPIGIELPPSVELRITETEPGFRGDTASGGGKPAVVQTGLKIQVPFFVNNGDLIKVDTRTGQYLERAN